MEMQHPQQNHVFFLKFSIFRHHLLFFGGSVKRYCYFPCLKSSQAPRQGMHCAQLWWWYHHANVHAFGGFFEKSLEGFWSFGRTWKYDDLVGGWTNPFEKYARQIGSSSPGRSENKKYLKPPPSDEIWWNTSSIRVRELMMTIQSGRKHQKHPLEIDLNEIHFGITLKNISRW